MRSLVGSVHPPTRPHKLTSTHVNLCTNLQALHAAYTHPTRSVSPARVQALVGRLGTAAALQKSRTRTTVDAMVTFVNTVSRRKDVLAAASRSAAAATPTQAAMVLPLAAASSGTDSVDVDAVANLDTLGALSRTPPCGTTAAVVNLDKLLHPHSSDTPVCRYGCVNLTVVLIVSQHRCVRIRSHACWG